MSRFTPFSLFPFPFPHTGSLFAATATQKDTQKDTQQVTSFFPLFDYCGGSEEVERVLSQGCSYCSSCSDCAPTADTPTEHRTTESTPTADISEYRHGELGAFVADEPKSLADYLDECLDELDDAIARYDDAEAALAGLAEPGNSHYKTGFVEGHMLAAEASYQHAYEAGYEDGIKEGAQLIPSAERAAITLEATKLLREELRKEILAEVREEILAEALSTLSSSVEESRAAHPAGTGRPTAARRAQWDDTESDEPTEVLRGPRREECWNCDGYGEVNGGWCIVCLGYGHTPVLSRPDGL